MPMAKDGTEEIEAGLVDEGGMIDEESGNDVPNGALKEEVRDDQPAMLSPGEFVMPAYAVRYFGVENLVKMLRAAKQGMGQLDDLGLTGEPNSDDAGLETAVLPSEMQEEGGMPTLAVGGMPTIKPGAVTTTALANQPTQMSAQQFGVAPPAATQPAVAPAFAAPSPLTQQMYRPTAPIRPPAQQNVTYPEFQYSPTPGGGGYGVEEYVGPQGQAIFVTTIGGKPVSKIPEGYVTRAEYTKKQEEGKTTTTPPTELQRKPEDMDPGSFEASEGGEGDGDPFGSTAASNFSSLANWAMGKGTIPTSLIGILGLIGKSAAKAYVVSESGKYFGKSKEELAKMSDKEIQTLVTRAVDTKVYVADKVKTGELTGRANQASNDAKNAETISAAIDAQTTPQGKEDVARAGAAQYGITVNTGNQGSGKTITAGSYTPPDASGMGSEPGGVEYSDPSFDYAGGDGQEGGGDDGGTGYGGGSYGGSGGGIGSGGFGGYFNATGGLIEKRKAPAAKKRGKGLASSK